MFPFLFPQPEPRGKSGPRTSRRNANAGSSSIQRDSSRVPRISTNKYNGLRRYIGSLTKRLEKRVPDRPLYIFQSNGGIARPEIVMRNPAQTLLSGPAGAVVGASRSV
ncbi:MAG: hypothetical protein CMM47_04185 [Rhodospirillaceae bacterium]|nr:hypothetical protein [Rhodospirillaceae bacterium]